LQINEDVVLAIGNHLDIGDIELDCFGSLDRCICGWLVSCDGLGRLLCEERRDYRLTCIGWLT